MIKIIIIFKNLHLYSFSKSTVLQWDTEIFWLSAFVILLMFAHFPGESTSVLSRTILTVPGCGVLAVGDCYEVLSKYTPTNKFK